MARLQEGRYLLAISSLLNPLGGYELDARVFDSKEEAEDGAKTSSAGEFLVLRIDSVLVVSEEEFKERFEHSDSVGTLYTILQELNDKLDKLLEG